MGIDVHTLHFLKWAARKSDGLGSVATIGRQNLHVSLPELSKIIKLPADYEHLAFCEELLKQCLGATQVRSFDNSSYEGADYVVDLNDPIIPQPTPLRDFQEINYANKRRRGAACRRLPQRRREHRGRRNTEVFASVLGYFFLWKSLN